MEKFYKKIEKDKGARKIDQEMKSLFGDLREKGLVAPQGVDFKLAHKLRAHGYNELASNIETVSAKKQNSSESKKSSAKFILGGFIYASLFTFILTLGVGLLLLNDRSGSNNRNENVISSVQIDLRLDQRADSSFDDKTLLLTMREKFEGDPKQFIQISPEVEFDVIDESVKEEVRLRIVPQETFQEETEYEISIKENSSFKDGSVLAQSLKWTFIPVPGPESQATITTIDNKNIWIEKDSILQSDEGFRVSLDMDVANSNDYLAEIYKVNRESYSLIFNIRQLDLSDMQKQYEQRINRNTSTSISFVPDDGGVYLLVLSQEGRSISTKLLNKTDLILSESLVKNGVELKSTEMKPLKVLYSKGLSLQTQDIVESRTDIAAQSIVTVDVNDKVVVSDLSGESVYLLDGKESFEKTISKPSGAQVRLDEMQYSLNDRASYSIVNMADRFVKAQKLNIKFYNLRNKAFETDEQSIFYKTEQIDYDEIYGSVALQNLQPGEYRVVFYLDDEYAGSALATLKTAPDNSVVAELPIEQKEYKANSKAELMIQGYDLNKLKVQVDYIDVSNKAVVLSSYNNKALNSHKLSQAQSNNTLQKNSNELSINPNTIAPNQNKITLITADSSERNKDRLYTVSLIDTSGNPVARTSYIVRN